MSRKSSFTHRLLQLPSLDRGCKSIFLTQKWSEGACSREEVSVVWAQRKLQISNIIWSPEDNAPLLPLFSLKATPLNGTREAEAGGSPRVPELHGECKNHSNQTRKVIRNLKMILVFASLLMCTNCVSLDFGSHSGGVGGPSFCVLSCSAWCQYSWLRLATLTIISSKPPLLLLPHPGCVSSICSNQSSLQCLAVTLGPSTVKSVFRTAVLVGRNLFSGHYQHFTASTSSILSLLLLGPTYFAIP